MVLERHILIHCYVVLPDFTRQLVPKDGKRPHKYCEENAKRNRFAEVLIVQIWALIWGWGEICEILHVLYTTTWKGISLSRWVWCDPQALLNLCAQDECKALVKLLPVVMGRSSGWSNGCPYLNATWKAGWWFQIFFIFTPTWGRFPSWLMFFRWVETTNSTSVSKNRRSNIFDVKPGVSWKMLHSSSKFILSLVLCAFSGQNLCES